MDRGITRINVLAATAAALLGVPASAQNLVVEGTITGQGNASFQQNVAIGGALTVQGATVSPAAQVPTGGVVAFAGSAAPAGFLLCNGAAVSRTTYAALFAVVGTTYGVGDGSTTFNLPDLRARSPIGAGQGPGLTNRALGGKGGAETHALTMSEMPSHTHTYTRNAWGTFNGVNWDLNGGAQGSNADVATTSAGGGGAHNNMQPFVALNFIIKT